MELEEAKADGGVVDDGLFSAGADQTLLGAEKDGVINEYIGVVGEMTGGEFFLRENYQSEVL